MDLLKERESGFGRYLNALEADLKNLRIECTLLRWARGESDAKIMNVGQEFCSALKVVLQQSVKGFLQMALVSEVQLARS